MRMTNATKPCRLGHVGRSAYEVRRPVDHDLHLNPSVRENYLNVSVYRGLYDLVLLRRRDDH